MFWCPNLAGKKQPLTTSNVNLSASTAARNDFLLWAKQPLSAALQQQTQQLLANWSGYQISKYNDFRSAPQPPNAYVLIIINGHCTESIKTLMQQAANYCLQHEISQMVIATDVNGARLTAQQQQVIKQVVLPAALTVQMVKHDCHHANLLAKSSAVVVTDSWLGLEALLWQKTVITCGDPFYAGLGLTQETKQPNAGLKYRLEQLVAWVFLVQANSFCPEQQQTIPLLTALAWLQLQNQQRQRFPQLVYAIGFTFFWKNVVRSFLQGSQVIFVRTAQQVPAGATAITWGLKVLPQLAADVTLYRLEDGFIRSVGLGALFAKPLSWVADSRGLYFDATASSDLEVLLNNSVFDDAILCEAKQLIKLLIQSNITKYNTGQVTWQRPNTDRKVLLVVGQVETDASIAFGAPGIKKNLDLLKTVRQDNPRAYIIYKPHPDVLAGARAQGENEQHAKDFCDAIAVDIDISAMLEQVDELHVLTSLAGFEALLRGRKVLCYGLPFYAGWGLTEDKVTCARRKRKLTLEQLVAAALLQYPMYLSAHSGYFTNAIATAKALSAWRNNPAKPTSLWQKTLRNSLNLIRGKR
ncbi:capsular polysaccharide biosynthesis protein [Rheinheimera sp. UJ51]|uniref:capsular polysaccharide export protein, LipB/KpsS family n=1 Tax=Rheinheimera sp. UJ51 TaxID=2892446 RepID=UPI001E3DDF4A|nr:capsular polysaccharide biosynthesis protein [Rheinheimera sp. UJ51]MCC5450298.1 capsular polysaccharide biosynthesis protein [Rheinheimera sp. UJ51]